VTSRLGSNGNSEIIIELDCKHRATFLRAHLPKIGERIYCLHCEAYRFVVAHLGMYHAVCDGCRFARYYGAARFTAQRRADSHARDYPGHSVAVTLGTERISVHTVSPKAVEISF
jgi:hypothetical protein